MPTPENIQLAIKVNGGAPQTGVVTAAFSDAIVLTLGASASAVKKAKYRIREFPEGFALPAGWTQDAPNIYSVTLANGADAPTFSLPASGNDLRGKYFFDCVANDQKRNGSVVSDLKATARLKIPFLSGIEDAGYLEEDEFDTVRHYVGAIKKLIRAFDAAVLSGGGVTLHSLLSGLSGDDHTQYDLARRPLSAYTGAANTIVLADARKTITTSHSGANALTIPPQGSVAWLTETLLCGINIGAGTMTLTAGAGVTLNGSVTVGANGWWWAKRTASNTWQVYSGGSTGLVIVGTPAVGNVPRFDGTQWVPGPLTAYAITAFTAATPVLEVGATATNPAFTAAHAPTPTALLLTNTDNAESKDVHATPTSFASSQSYTKTANNATVTFTITGSDGITPANRSTSIAWRPRVYWGTGVAGLTTEAQIEALASSELLASRVKTFAVNATGSLKVYFACPASYGTPTFTVGGFSGGFTLVSSTISVTNVNGTTQNYQLWESDVPGLSSITVAVT